MRIEGDHARSAAPGHRRLRLLRRVSLGSLTAAAALLIALGTGGIASASVTVTVPCSGSGGGSAGLITAILSADLGGGGTITLASGCTYAFTGPYTDTSQGLAGWFGPAALPAIAAPITIVGNGATISGASSASDPFRLFFVGANASATATPGWTSPGGGTLLLDDLTLSGGFAHGGNSALGGAGLGAGGAIFNQGTTVLSAVTLSGNTAQGGSAGVGSGLGGGGIGSSSSGNDGGGFGTGFVAPGGAPTGGGGVILGLLGAGGGGGGFETGESGVIAVLTRGGVGGGAATGTGGNGYTYDNQGPDSGDGAGGGSSSLALLEAGNGGGYGQGGLGESGGGAGGGGVGGGGGGASAGAGGGFGGGGGSPKGEGGFGGGGGGGGSGGAGFGAGAGGATNGGGGAGLGGAIFNQAGTLVLENSTLSGNSAAGGSAGGSDATAGQGLGGAIFSLNGGVVLVNNTIASNTADSGGAVYLVGYDATAASSAAGAALVNNILAGSTTAAKASTDDLVVAQPATVANGTRNYASAIASAAAPNIIQVHSGAGTLSGTPSTANPLLGPLANNGGPGMFTMLPQAGSPAIGAGTKTNAPTTDERGTARPAAGPIDLGAVQVSGAAATAGAPQVTTIAANPVSSSKATLNATVNPEGRATTYNFEYGTSTNYTGRSSSGTISGGTSAIPVTATISGLKPNTTYHYRIVAASTGGTTNGSDRTFKTTEYSPTGLTVTTKPLLATKFPYRYSFSGKLGIPKGITNGAACSGRITVTIKRGKTTVTVGRTSLFVGCTWKLSVRLSNRRAVPGKGKLSVTVSFGGNAVLAPRTNKAFTIRYG